MLSRPTWIRSARSGSSLIAGQPIDRRLVAELLDDRPGARADRRVRVIVQLAAANDRDLVGEQPDQQARHSSLGLTALSQKHELLPAQDRVLVRRQDGVLITDDARKDRLPLAEPRQQVSAELL